MPFIHKGLPPSKGCYSISLNLMSPSFLEGFHFANIGDPVTVTHCNVDCYFVYHFAKVPGKIRLRKEGLFGLRLDSAMHCGGDGLAAGEQGTWSHCTTSGELLASC